MTSKMVNQWSFGKNIKIIVWTKECYRKSGLKTWISSYPMVQYAKTIFNFSLSKDVVTGFWLMDDQLGLTDVSEENECTISGKPSQPVILLKMSYNMMEGLTEKNLYHRITNCFSNQILVLVERWFQLIKCHHSVKRLCLWICQSCGKKRRNRSKKGYCCKSAGRSHRTRGTARDHFKLVHCEDSDWYIIVVADGAGSKYSMKGSEIACETVVAHCLKSSRTVLPLKRKTWIQECRKRRNGS